MSEPVRCVCGSAMTAEGHTLTACRELVIDKLDAERAESARLREALAFADASIAEWRGRADEARAALEAANARADEALTLTHGMVGECALTRQQRDEARAEAEQWRSRALVSERERTEAHAGWDANRAEVERLRGDVECVADAVMVDAVAVARVRGAHSTATRLEELRRVAGTARTAHAKNDMIRSAEAARDAALSRVKDLEATEASLKATEHVLVDHLGRVQASEARLRERVGVLEGALRDIVKRVDDGDSYTDSRQMPDPQLTAWSCRAIAREALAATPAATTKENANE